MGIFDDADVDIANDIPNDPYGFGRDRWPVEIVEVRQPDISKSGKQYGTMVKYKCIDPTYSWMESLGNGNWLQLPPPKYVLETAPDIKWDKNSEQGKKCLFAIKQLFEGLGIPVDQWNSLEITDLVGKQCMAKIFPKQNDEGFWQFNVTGMKPMPEEGSGDMSVFAGGNSTQSNSGKSAAELALEAEMKGA